MLFARLCCAASAHSASFAAARRRRQRQMLLFRRQLSPDDAGLRFIDIIDIDILAFTYELPLLHSCISPRLIILRLSSFLRQPG